MSWPVPRSHHIVERTVRAYLAPSNSLAPVGVAHEHSTKRSSLPRVGRWKIWRTDSIFAPGRRLGMDEHVGAPLEAGRNIFHRNARRRSSLRSSRRPVLGELGRWRAYDRQTQERLRWTPFLSVSPNRN